MSLSRAPIQKSLLSIILLTCGATLLLTCASFITYEYFSYKNDLAQRHETLGRIIATNCTAALLFDDAEGAQDVVNSVYSELDVSAAILFDSDGTPVARYPLMIALEVTPNKISSKVSKFEDGRLYGFTPIMNDNRQLGTLYLEFDMTPLYDRLQLYAGLGLGIFLASMIVAFLLSRELQRKISRPIQHLVSTAKAITERGDYSVRAEQFGDNEFKHLTEAFNHMLADIDQRDMELRLSQERFRLMVANVKDYAIIMLDPEGLIQTWNPSAERIEGFTSGEIIGKHISGLPNWGAMPELSAQRALEIAESNGHCEYEGWRRAQDGERLYVQVVISSLFDEHGCLRGFCKVAHDITERKANEEHIEALNRDLELRVHERTLELQAANKELEAFCYSVSHDLRAPLRSIHGFSQALLEDAQESLKGEELDYLNRICGATKRMGELIDGLLLLSRLNRNDLQLEEINLTEMVESIISELEESTPGRQVEWKIAPGVIARADRKLMGSTMTNLLNNAFKYTQKTDCPSIEFGVKEHNGVETYFVRDNGAGFDMAYADKLFGPFQRLHGVHEFAGIGIGLATVFRIISRHGGRVWGEGEVGKGATFYFTLGAVRLPEPVVSHSVLSPVS